MVRTQIYLTESEQQALRRLARQTGRTQSELIREAVDRFITHREEGDRSTLLRSAFGVWRYREDLPDFDRLRTEFDRFVADAE